MKHERYHGVVVA